MRKFILIAALVTGVIQLHAQADKSEILQDLEKNQPSNQIPTTTATLKSSSRLFGTKDDLTTVILIIPSGSIVSVLGSDSTYLQVAYEQNEGYILKRHAVIDKTMVSTSQVNQTKKPVEVEQQVDENQSNRFSDLESKYGSNMAARLISGKIWKGMNAEMVKDSWGTAQKINRVISGNIIKEEWIFKNTWLYFENNTLVEWGPIRK